MAIPSSVIAIGASGFDYCSRLTAIEVATDNPNYASQDGVLFSKDTTTLIRYPMGKVGTAYAIPNRVTTIGIEAFLECDSLTSITIPNSVAAIGRNAFTYCGSLTEVISLNPQPLDIESSVFSYVDKATCTLKVPVGSASLYRAAEGWKEFANIVEQSSFDVVRVDTVYVEVTDTVYTKLVDTVRVEVTDTIYVEVVDTVFAEVVDTVYVEVVDTVFVEVIDTVRVEVVDTVFVHDTIYLTDTVCPDKPKPTAVVTNEQALVKLYPNPVVNGELKIENGEWGSGTFSTFNSQLSIEIYSLSGALVAKVPTAGGRTTVNVSALPSGTYIVKAGQHVGKFVKQ
jgi:hypothetical protein